MDSVVTAVDAIDESEKSFFARAGYWQVRLLMVIFVGSLVIELIRLGIVSTRLLWRRLSMYKAASRQECETQLMGNIPAIAWHLANHAFCVALVVHALDKDLLDADNGIAWELLEIWVMFTLVDFCFQAIIRRQCAMILQWVTLSQARYSWRLSPACQTALTCS